jgi:hypothetical protein
MWQDKLRNSDAESCTGIGVGASFADAVGMIESSHMEMAESVACIRYLYTFMFRRNATRGERGSPITPGLEHGHSPAARPGVYGPGWRPQA